MSNNKSLTDKQALAVMILLAIAMLASIFWGVNHPATHTDYSVRVNHSNLADELTDFEIITQGTVTVDEFEPQLVWPKTKVNFMRMIGPPATYPGTSASSSRVQTGSLRLEISPTVELVPISTESIQDISFERFKLTNYGSEAPVRSTSR